MSRGCGTHSQEYESIARKEYHGGQHLCLRRISTSKATLNGLKVP
jgi:hypothetical protein